MPKPRSAGRRSAPLVMELLEDRTTPATLPAGFTEVAVATGVSGGTAMEFAPNGDLWVLEQTGAVKRFRPGSATADVVANLSAVGLDPNGERGLLGIAFDPAYATNKWVYLYYTSTDSPSPHNRVSRFTVNDANTADYSFVDTTANPALLDEVEILNLEQLSFTNHNGGAIHFGPDGKLYVAVGENNVPSNAQSLANRLGKILRINADGSIPGDNPTSFAGIAGSPTGDNRAIWAVGLRNPYTFTFQPGTGVMHVNDVGQGAWEEVNVGGAGRNYGWPQTEGPNPGGQPGVTYPLYAYSHGSGTLQGRAISGGAFYNPATSQFPSDYAGDYFFGEYVNDRIYVTNANGSEPRTFATGASGVVDLRVTADGSLYYLARDVGQAFRVVFTGAPSITQHPQDANVTSGGNASFAIAASGTGTLTYQWQKFTNGNWANLANGGVVSGATTATLTLTGVTAGDAGQYRAVVTNANGSTNSNAATLNVTPAGVTIVDDGDAGYSAAGWQRATGAGFAEYFGSDTGFRQGAPGASPATWAATNLAAGTYRVSATWTAFPNRATDAAYAVANGAGTTLASRTLSQEASPDDLSADGAVWEDLGTVTLTAAGSLVVSLSGVGNEFLIADAVRFELVPPPPPPPPPGAVTIVDDGDGGYSAPGWQRATGGGFAQYFGSDTGFRLGAAGAGPATWAATGLAAGTYRVSATWTADPNRATDAAYAVRNGAGATLAARTVNQEASPDDLSADGAVWEDLGTVTLTAAGSLVVSLSGVGNEFLIADAIRFELVPPPPPPPVGSVVIVDDGDGGYSAAGWQRASGAGFAEYYGSDTGYVSGGAGAGPATWTASGLAAGTYRVSATWTADPNRATDAAYAVRNGAGATLAARTVNQEASPDDLSADGAVWEDLGTVTLTAAGTLVVSLSGQGNEFLIADAIRIERLS